MHKDVEVHPSPAAAGAAGAAAAAAPATPAAGTLQYKSAEPPARQVEPHPATVDLALNLLDRWRWFILAPILLCYLAAFNGQWRIGADSALYVSLGRNIAEGKGYTYQGDPHTWVEPGLPLLIAASFKIFGIGVFWPIQLLLLALGLLCLLLIYQLFTLHAGRPVAVMITALVGVAELFFQYVYEIRTDIPFFVGLLTFLLGYERIWHDRARRNAWQTWALMLAGLWVMLLFRPVVMTFLGALFATVAWHLVRGPHRLRHLAVGLLALASVFAFRALDPRRANVGDTVYRESVLRQLLTERLGDVVVRTSTKFIPKVAQELFPEAIFAFEFGDGLDQLMCVIFLGASIWLLRRRVLWAMWIAATFAQIVIWWPLTRYFLPILPFLLYAAHIPVRAVSIKLDRLDRRYAWAFLAACTTSLVLVNAAHVVRFAWHQHQTPFIEHFLDGKHVGTTRLAELMKTAVDDDDIVLADSHRVLTYFSGKRVLELPKWKQGDPDPRILADFDAKIAAARNVYVVLPAHERVQQHLTRLRIQPGPPVLTAPGYTLNRVMPAPVTPAAATQPATQPATHTPLPSTDDDGP